jgi:hypothetical protein
MSKVFQCWCTFLTEKKWLNINEMWKSILHVLSMHHACQLWNNHLPQTHHVQ